MIIIVVVVLYIQIIINFQTYDLFLIYKYLNKNVIHLKNVNLDNSVDYI